MASLFFLWLFLSVNEISYCEVVDCPQGDCSCIHNNENCDLQCFQYQGCYKNTGGHSILDCNAEYQCGVNCDGYGSTFGYACQNVIINSNDATYLEVNCTNYRDCLYATINCGDSANCDVYCRGYAYGYNCDTVTLNCGTSKCSVTCHDDSSCFDINVISSLALSFKCIGSSTACSAAPPPFSSPTQNPATPSPTPSPTAAPSTLSPIATPTWPPTSNPTTNIPTTTPPTTFQPTSQPTPQPTTLQPSFAPQTHRPTSNAPTTFQPSFAPQTHGPTTNKPTTSRPTTYVPTSSPTLRPTIGSNTNNPSHSASKATEIQSSESTTSLTRFDESPKSQNGVYFQEIQLVLICIFCVIILASYIDAKYVRNNDFYVFGALVTASVQTLDLISNIFFSLHINVNVNVNQPSYQLTVILLISIICILLPALMSLVQLHFEIKQWLQKGNDSLNEWIRENVQILFVVSAICGSAFTGIELAYCNAFGLRQFDIPLSKIQLTSFQSKRIYSTVLLENIPQLMVQIWFVIICGNETNVIVYSSIIFSILSIITSIMSIITQRRIMRERHFVSVRFDVMGQRIVMKAHKLRNCIKSIKRQIAALLGLDIHILEILRPNPTRNGLHIHINIYINHTQAIDGNIKATMKEAKNVGLLARIFKEGWKLKCVPIIRNVKYCIHESKERRDNTVFIKADNAFNYIPLTEIKQNKNKGIRNAFKEGNVTQDFEREDVSSDSEEYTTTKYK